MNKEEVSKIINAANDLFGDASNTFRRRFGWLINIRESAECSHEDAEKIFRTALSMKLLKSEHICSHDYHYYVVDSI